MTDRENLYKGISHAAWGYFFLNFDFNLGTVSIFPRFAGYVLFFLAIRRLAGERRDLLLLRPLCVLLGAWTAGDWLLSWGGAGLDGRVLFLDLMAAAAELYFQYQFLTDMAALAETYRPAENNLDVRLRRRRTVYIVLVTAIALVSTQPALLPEGSWQQWTVLGLAAAVCIVSLTVMAGLFELRKFFLPDPAEDSPA